MENQPQENEQTVFELQRELRRRGYSRREVFQIAGAFGLAGLLAACGGQVKPQTDQGKAAAGTAQPTSLYSISDADGLQWPKTAIPEPTSKVQITVSHSWDAAFWPRQEQFDTLFMKRHPNISVTTENTVFNGYLQKYITQAAAGNLPDVMYCQYAWAQQFITLGALSPLDDYIAKQPDFNIDDFTAPSLGFYKRDNKLYGVAYDCGPGVLFYNKDMFDKAGVAYPNDKWTLDDLKQAAIKLTSGSGANKVFGLGRAPTPGDGTLAPAFLYPFGAKFVDEPQETQSFINQPNAVQAMEWWMELLTKYQAMPNLSDLQAFQQQNAFTLGRAAMFNSGSWAAPALSLSAKFKWDIAHWPKGPQKQSTFAAGSAYTITKNSNQKDAAWIYMNEYLSTAGSTFMWGLTGRGSPARKSVWPSYLKSKFAPPGVQRVFDALNSYASNDILHQPTTPKVTNSAQPIWDQVMAGKQDVKSALEQITQQVNPILAQNRK